MSERLSHLRKLRERWHFCINAIRDGLVYEDLVSSACHCKFYDVDPTFTVGYVRCCQAKFKTLKDFATKYPREQIWLIVEHICEIVLLETEAVIEFRGLDVFQGFYLIDQNDDQCCRRLWLMLLTRKLYNIVLNVQEVKLPPLRGLMPLIEVNEASVGEGN